MTAMVSSSRSSGFLKNIDAAMERELLLASLFSLEVEHPEVELVPSSSSSLLSLWW